MDPQRRKNLKYIIKDSIKSVSNLILAVLAYFLFYTVRYILPIKIASATGRFIGKHIFANIPIKRKHEVIRNISLAFPNLSQKEVLDIYKNSCSNFGQVIFEIPKVEEISKDDNNYKVKDDYGALKTMSEGQCLLFTAHIGNWELAGFSLLKQKNLDTKSINVIYKAPNNPYLRKLFAKLRVVTNTNIITLNKKTLLELNKKAKTVPFTVYMLVDQRIKEGLNTVTMFNRPAPTSPLLPMFALKYNIPLVPLKVIRNKDGYYEIEYEKPLEYEKTGNYKKDLKNLTQAMNNHVEQWIKAYPDQWFWLHRRW